MCSALPNFFKATAGISISCVAFADRDANRSNIFAPPPTRDTLGNFFMPFGLRIATIALYRGDHKKSHFFPLSSQRCINLPVFHFHSSVVPSNAHGPGSGILVGFCSLRALAPGFSAKSSMGQPFQLIVYERSELREGGGFTSACFLQKSCDFAGRGSRHLN